MLVLALITSIASADVAAAGPLMDPGEGAAPPLAHATLAPDGRYDLLMQPPRAWEEAEITIGGDGAYDVGAVDMDEPLRLGGVTSSQGELWVVVQAVDASDHGITWMFSVDPERVPMGSPASSTAAEPGRRGFFGIFGARPGSGG